MNVLTSTGTQFEATTRIVRHPNGVFESAEGRFDICLMEMKQDPSLVSPPSYFLAYRFGRLFNSKWRQRVQIGFNRRLYGPHELVRGLRIPVIRRWFGVGITDAVPELNMPTTEQPERLTIIIDEARDIIPTEVLEACRRSLIELGSIPQTRRLPDVT